jgi:hypothetical protein
MRLIRRTTLLVLCTAATACTTMGTGTGSETPGNVPVNFSWKSKGGGTSGTMTATLPDGRTFTGPFLQPVSAASTEDFGPMWRGWHYGWSDWDGFPAFTTFYSDRVMANLQASDGERMRCGFHLNDPVQGMSGGGQGQCQLASGGSIDAVFRRG